MRSGPVAQEDGIPSPGQNAPSISQQRLWVLERLHPRNPAHNISCGLRLTGPLDAQEFGRAWREVVQPCEILRTEFHAVEGIPQTVVVSSVPQLSHLDLESVPPEERETTLSQLAREEARRPFDLTSGPLLRAFLWRLAPLEYVLLLVSHRIVCDEASLAIILRQLASRYRTGQSGEPSTPGQIAMQYSEYGSRRGRVSEEQISYWKQQLAAAPASIDLPIDRMRPAEQTFLAAAQRFSIGKPVLENLRKVGDSHSATLFVTLLAAFNVLLSRYSRQEDLVVGIPISGRIDPTVENLVGPIENTIVIRTDLSAEPTFSQLLTRVREIAGEAFSRQEVPFEVLLEQLPLVRDLSRNPLFQVAFCLRQARVNDRWAGGVSATSFEAESGTERFEISLDLIELADSIEGRLSYNTDLFDASTIERMTVHFQILLESATQDPETPVSRLPMMSDTERHQLLVEWNDTRVEYPISAPLNKFFEDQVEKTPESVAVIFEGKQLTYGQLNCRANQLAHRLKKSGVGPDVLVAVCAERSLELVIGLLAILKAGGAYVPFDPEYPKDRLETMLQDSDPPIVLTQSHLLDRIPDNARHVFCLDRDWPSLETESTDNLPATVGGKNLAYAIYTSGSTGKPKGVPNVHEGIVNRVLWGQDMYQLTGKDRVLQKTPFSFDISVWEFFWPLMTGATLVMARPGGHRDPAYLVDLIAKQGITTLHFVPSMLSIFLESDGLERCRSVRQVFASGEALPFELQQRFFERFKAELHNLYGPTEAAVEVTYWACRPNTEQAIVPIGRPIANTQIYILDASLQPVPIGVAGELHIGGISLARGYLNRPELTAEKFIPDPFSPAPGARLYKTGDLARFLADGNIEYMGRIDHQVKLRGFRIELGEIEAVLGECTGVLQAVVTVREGNSGDKRLIAYLIASPGYELDVDRLRGELKDKLPEYMVPSRFVFVEGFPMTTSGKVDRKALPAPPAELGISETGVAPRNELESRLASIFANVLDVPSVGVTDNFFDLGGHSLTAARLLSQINNITGRQIPLSALFRGATVESLARLFGEHDGASDPVVMEIQRGHIGRLPFFAIVPPGEESLGYAILARHMGPEQTVYKIQGHGSIRGEHPYTSQELQSLAIEYVAAIRTVQPEGPYCLGGLCAGVHIGERVVVELEAQGQEVALFASIDTWVMQHSQRPWLWRAHYFQQRLRAASSRNWAEQFQIYKRAAINQLRKLVGKAPLRTEWHETYWPTDFVPTRFRAPVVLFKRPKQPFFYVKDPQMGWGARTMGGVEIYEIDFDHLNLLREPHVCTVGKKLAACIERVSGQSGHPAKPADSFSPQQPVTSGGRSG
jgi:amino acid adenylation domain-containing protein